MPWYLSKNDCEEHCFLKQFDFIFQHSFCHILANIIFECLLSIVGEVMNLDDFLDEVSDPDPKYGSPRRCEIVGFFFPKNERKIY